jgi:hypothetical protein
MSEPVFERCPVICPLRFHNDRWQCRLDEPSTVVKIVEDPVCNGLHQRVPYDGRLHRAAQHGTLAGAGSEASEQPVRGTAAHQVDDLGDGR